VTALCHPQGLPAKPGDLGAIGPAEAAQMILESVRIDRKAAAVDTRDDREG
jgi:hypothetical protein